MKYFIFLAYLIRHKWFVFRECLRLGVPWQGLVHDISKFLPGEFSAYADYYQRLQLGNGENTGLVAEDDSHALAWLVHQKRNRHHWQWWVLYGDRAQPTILPMPDRYIREMVADWRGAGMAQGQPDTIGWYRANRDRMLLHPSTRSKVESLLGRYENQYLHRGASDYTPEPELVFDGAYKVST